MTKAPATITNYSTLIFLINPKVRAIKAVYEPLRDKYVPGVAMQLSADSKPIKVETFKTFDPMVSVDDYILVPSDTRHKMTVCKVVEVDVTVELDSQEHIDWVMGILDRDAYEEVKRAEEAAIQRVKSAKANAAREELKKQLLADVDSASLDIDTLRIAHMGEPEPIKPQTPGT